MGLKRHHIDTCRWRALKKLQIATAEAFSVVSLVHLVLMLAIIGQAKIKRLYLLQSHSSLSVFGKKKAKFLRSGSTARYANRF